MFCIGYIHLLFYVMFILEALCMILCEKAMGKYRVVKCTINRDHFMHHNIPE